MPIHCPPPGPNGAPAASLPTANLPIADLETVYDSLASAIDAAGPDKATLLLVKLVLLQANTQGQADVFLAQLQAALQDL